MVYTVRVPDTYQNRTMHLQVSIITRKRAAEFLENETGGRIFSVYFQKKDQTMREMVCRRGVRKYLRGGELPYDPKSRLLLPVFEVSSREYRMVNIASLVSFKVSGETFIVQD
jgi:hypothetical protein